MLSMVLFGLLGVWQGGPYQPLGRTPESSNKHILIPGSGSLVPREGWETSKASCFLLPVDHSLGLTFLEPQQGDPKGPKTITLPPAWPQRSCPESICFSISSLPPSRVPLSLPALAVSLSPLLSLSLPLS